MNKLAKKERNIAESSDWPGIKFCGYENHLDFERQNRRCYNQYCGSNKGWDIMSNKRRYKKAYAKNFSDRTYCEMVAVSNFNTP